MLSNNNIAREHERDEQGNRQKGEDKKAVLVFWIGALPLEGAQHPH